MGDDIYSMMEIRMQNVGGVDCITRRSDENQSSTQPMKQYTDAPLYKVLRPIFTGMKLLGLFHHKQYIGTDEHRSEDVKNQLPPISKRITPSSIYSFLVMLIL